MIDRKNGLTYADSGVDIDAGNRLVDLIKPMVRATARAGADAEIGGFGGCSTSRRRVSRTPVLVAATDGVGTKVKIAIETGLHGGIGIDLVAMSVNDLVVQGAEPLFFLDYFACGKLDPRRPRRSWPASRRAAGNPVAPDRRRDRRDAGALQGRRLRPRGLCGGTPSAARCCRAGYCRGRRGDRIGLVGALQRLSLVRKIVENSGLGFDAPAPFSPVMTLGGALLAPTKLYVKSCLRAIRETGAIKGLAHITGGGFTDNIPRVLPASRRRHRSGAAAGAAGVQMAGGAGRHRRTRTAAHLQLRHRHDRHRQAGCDRAGDGILTESGETVALLGEVIPACGRTSRGLQRSPRSFAMKRRRHPDLRARIEHGRADRRGEACGFSAEIVAVISSRPMRPGLRRSGRGRHRDCCHREQAVRQGSRRLRSRPAAGAGGKRST